MSSKSLKMPENPPNCSFDLNLNFTGFKNPSEAFKQIGNMYDKLMEIDRFVLYNVLPSAKIDYELIDIGYGSLKSKVAQVLRSIPDDVIKDVLNPQKLIGHTLVYIKHRILKAIENNEVNSKETLGKVTDDINKRIDKLEIVNGIVFNINNYFVLNSINDITIESRKLKKQESFEYISTEGKSTIFNSPSPNMAKILFELGDQKIEQSRTETLKVKSLDLLSERAKWKLIRNGIQIDVSIRDQEWLKLYHNRAVTIQPNDYLKLDLKISYQTNGLSIKPLIHYDALKIYEVIPPDRIEKDDQMDLFEIE